MTVLLVLACFAVFVTLDYVVTRRRLARTTTMLAAPPMAALEPAWVAGYQMPDALYYHRGHTWARPVDGDTVLVGVDDFARRLIGPASLMQSPSRGDWIRQGGPAFALGEDDRVAHLVSPVEGEVVAVNREQPAAANDPYGRGWVLQVKAPNLGENLRNLLSGRLARKWMEDSREALDLRLMALSGSVLQDGGEPASDFATHLPDADWARLTREFLLM